MKVSYEWLREYINMKIRAENLRSVLTMAGLEVTAVEKKDNDVIFEIETTPNRPDWLSHMGVAREVAAITKKPLRIPKVKSPPVAKTKAAKIKIEDKEACAFYSGRVIKDVFVDPSPKWLIKRVESIGLRPVNNIVDITNFVLFETGQPLHAFDFDKIAGGEVMVRRARKGEKIVTIDGVERTLDEKILVIADSKRPIAIAGIMGGKDTEVTEYTENIFLESAYFDPYVTRRAALLLGLGSDSSYRFERGVDPKGIVPASDRASCIICDIAKAQAGRVITAGKSARDSRKITLRTKQVNRLLGTDLKSQDVKEILTRLGCRSKGSAPIEVVAPSYRDDLTREADIIEEIARIYGYDKIPLTPPNIMATEESQGSKDTMKKTSLAKEALLSLGFNESLTYSLLSRQVIESMNIPEQGIIEIGNPLSKEQEVMRPSLLPGVIKVISHNISRQVNNVKVFELSNIYFQKEANYNEEPFLALAQYSKSSGLFHLKGAIEALGKSLDVANLGFEKTNHLQFVPEETLAILSGDLMLGTMGRVRSDILERFDVKEAVFAAELNFKTVMDHANLSRSYKPLPRYPYSYRDISLSVDHSVAYRDMANLIKKTGGALIEDVDLLSEYRGEGIREGQRGLAFRVIYRAKDRTLTEEEISNLDVNIRKNLTKEFNVTLR